MKSDIHPQYHANAKIACACGNVVEAGSTVPEVAIELCAKCHPFYTGKQNLVDTAGRVDRFARMKSLAIEGATGKKVKAEKRAAQKAAKKAAQPAAQIEA